MNGKSSLKEQIYDAVLEDIIKGVYQQTDIISEKQLIEKYGVSKSPVRDALIELCNEEILRSIPRYGYEIVRLTERDIRNIIEFRSIVEPQCLRISAREMSDADLSALMEYTQESCRQSCQVDIWKHWENNMRFHLRLISYCGNQYCHSAVKKSLNILTRAYAQFHWDRWKKTSFLMDCEGHLRIVQALLERDAETAVKELVLDIGSFDDILFK